MGKDWQSLAPHLDLEGDVLPALGIDPLDVSGDEIIAHCPDLIGMHKRGDANPSFAVNKRKLMANCFLCGGISLLELVMTLLELDREQAIAWLEEQAFSTEPREEFIDVIEDLLKQPAPEHLIAFPSYSPSLFKYESFHPYLEERGVTMEVAEEMNVGHDSSHDAIAIPHWHRGQLVGIQYRHLGRCSICGDKPPKYKNTPNFPKNWTFYNLDQIIREGHSQAIVVESPFSVLYLKSHGIHNAIASFGTNIPVKKAELLYRFHDGVLFWPDNDKPGLKSVEDALIIVERVVPTFLVPLVPGAGHDVADLDPEEIPKYLKSAYSSTIFPLDGFRKGIRRNYGI